MSSDIRARWFEDWVVGEVIETDASYTMDQDRIIEFAKEFDPQVFHTDPEAAKTTIYGGLIASGWHTGSVMMWLMTTLLGEASMGSPGCDELRWPAPVRPGDTLRLRLEVLETVPSKSKPDRGVVRVTQRVLNQRDEVVMSLSARMILERREATDGPRS